MQFKVRGLEELIKTFDPELVGKPLQRFFKQATTLIANQAKRNAPVDSGRLRSSIVGEIDSRDVPLFGKVGSDVHYAPYIEYGTGAVGDPEVPHKARHWPPGHALGLWAGRHGFESGFQVAAIIGKRGGLLPRLFLRSAKEQSEGQVGGLVDDLGVEIQRQWEAR